MELRDLMPGHKRHHEMKHAAPESNVFVLHRKMQDEFDKIFSSFFRGIEEGRGLEAKVDFYPRVDVREDEKEIEITAEVPGVEQKDLQLSIKENILTISGEKKFEREEKKEEYYHCERSYGTFRRSIQLSSEVKEDEVEAVFKNGVLKVLLPKSAAAIQTSKQIEIKGL